MGDKELVRIAASLSLGISVSSNKHDLIITTIFPIVKSKTERI